MAVSGGGGVGVKAALLLGLVVALLAVAGLGLAEALDVTVLAHPVPQMRAHGAAAALGTTLLVADIVVPVPSSLVMLGHGALFGVSLGAVLSLLGRTGNAVAGVVLGRGVSRLFGRRDGGRDRMAEDLVGRWGVVAVLLTRPVPVLAEATLVAAGAMRMSPPAVVLAAVVGSVPEAVLYALAGSTAASFANGALVFAATLGLAAGAVAVQTQRGGGRRNA